MDSSPDRRSGQDWGLGLLGLAVWFGHGFGGGGLGRMRVFAGTHMVGFDHELVEKRHWL